MATESEQTGTFVPSVRVKKAGEEVIFHYIIQNCPRKTPGRHSWPGAAVFLGLLAESAPVGVLIVLI